MQKAISFEGKYSMIGFEDSKKKWDAIRDMWAETGLDTDAVDVELIVDWFDRKRNIQDGDVHIVEIQK